MTFPFYLVAVWLQKFEASYPHKKLLQFVSASSHFNSKRNFLRISKVSLARAVLQAHFWTNYWQHNNIITRANSNQSAFCFSKLFLLWKHSWLAMLVSGVPQSIFLQIIYSYKSSQDIEYRPLCYTVNPCCVSVSCIIVCICLSRPLNLSSPLLLGNHTNLFFISVNLYHRSRFHIYGIVFVFVWLTLLSIIISESISVNQHLLSYFV